MPDRPVTNKSVDDKPVADKPIAGKPFADKPGTNTPAAATYKQSFAETLMREAGLVHVPACYRDYHFLLALLGGAFVLWAIHDWMPPFSSSIKFNWALLLSLIIWQPLIEEILFRGIIQGQFSKHDWGKHSWLKISTANMVTSTLFVAIHMFNSSPLFALTVFVPSLVFGYFREHCNSVYPSILLHSAYNAMVFAGLILNGNMIIASL